MSQTLKDIAYLPVEAVLGALMNFQDAIAKLKLIGVETTEDSYYDMPEKPFNRDEMLRNLVDVDDDGDFAIRVGVHSVTGSTKLTKGELTQDQLFRNMIGVSTDGKPYLRIVFQELA